MIPLKDDVPSRTYPVMNVALIVVNVVVFLFEVGLGERLDSFVETLGVIPAAYFNKGFIIDGEFVPITLSRRIISFLLVRTVPENAIAL